MRFFFLFLLAPLLFLAEIPATALATQAPPAQVALKAGDVLRGNFVQVTKMHGLDTPIQSSGRFVLAPGHGLIWAMQKPFPTSTIITPQGSVQDIGGVAVKLPIRHLYHLYATIGGALMGDWGGLAKDFVIARGGGGDHWRMFLTPRHPGKLTLPYSSITVSGGRFIESIAMIKADGGSDTLNFMDEKLTAAPLAPDEQSVFDEVHQ